MYFYSQLTVGIEIVTAFQTEASNGSLCPSVDLKVVIDGYHLKEEVVGS
jgi:hypothetical protein